MRRLVAERGSNAAISLPGPKRPLSASTVSRIAVGWWAKSSTTVTPRATPRTSCRRRTPRKPRTAARDRRQLDAQRRRHRDRRRPGSRGCRCRAGSSRRRRRARPRRATASVVRPPDARAADLERPVGARAGPAVGHDLRARAARDLHRPRRGRAGDQQAVLGDERDELAERGAHRLLVPEDVGVIELDRRQERDLAAGNGGTSSPCRRTRCRTRRPRRRTPRRAPSRQDWRKLSGTPPIRNDGIAPRVRAARAPAATTSSSCRACPRRPPTGASPRPARTACRTATETIRAECPRSCAASTSTWSLRQTLPTTTRPAPSRGSSARKPSKQRMF